MEAAETCGLYLITPPQLDPDRFRGVLSQALDAAPVAAVQLRLKDASDADWQRAIDALRPVAQSRGVAFLLNDRVDLVFPNGCDGVHVGQDDMPARQARAFLGPDPMLGVTCHDSRDLAMQAGEDSADYVAFGAFFPTGTKLAKATAHPDLLRWWSELMEIPCVAIGGITTANASGLIQAGADFLAVCAGVWQHPDGPAEAVRQLAAETARAPRS